MKSEPDFDVARAMLEWQLEMGATDAIGETPVDRYARPAAVSEPRPQGAPLTVNARQPDDAAAARALAAQATDLTSLAELQAGFDGCELKKGARNFVFSDGVPGARVMIIGEAPGRDEDAQGKPFVGRAGQLLDKMFDAIGMSRTEGAGAPIYITNILPWRPPQNRDPKPEEIGMMLPFVERHVALAGPQVLVLTGNISCQAVLGRRGITRLRGNWTQGLDLPVLPMFHPAYLLRNPAAKREAWRDLLALQARLRDGA
ncbi:MAG: uracil-DNA glycosylase [Pseudomonadota bacterium]